ncbi:MAG TPA: hypothetical protein VHZ33_23815 [Trebonia sp.]|jgi:hypothetical protein|nr:hypothetical protein [Trebonia sp.]
MSQVAKRTRVQRLADSVLPGRTVGGYANLIEARLRKLAATGSTGMLPMSGHGDGAIFFRAGQVIYAESTRTPTPVRRTVGLAALGLLTTPAPVSNANANGAHGAHGTGAHGTGAHGTGSAPSNGADLVAVPSLDRLVGMLALTEPTIDAITELLASDSRYAKFRPSDYPPSGQLSPLPIETVLAEVERRHQVLRQLSPVVAPDSPVVRYAPRDLPSFQVSAAQWQLLVRTGNGSTPRTLALALGRSVFGTTIEVYRLLALGLLVIPGQAPAITAGPSPARRPAEVMSFMRALADAGGPGGHDA